MRSLILTLLIAASASAQLTGRPDKDARTVLQSGLTEGVESRRELAVALSLISAREPAAVHLGTLAKDGDHLVRTAAVESLGELGDRTKTELLRSALKDDVPEVVFAAARSLYRLDPARSRPVLVSILERETDAKSSFFSAQLRSFLRTMKTPRSALMFAGRMGAGFLPVPGLGAGLAAMNSMLLDADFSARALALTLLAEERPLRQATLQLLTKSLTDEDWSVRAAAIQAVATKGQPSERRQLVPLFADRDRKVRYRAAAAWLRMEYLAQSKQPAR